MHWEDKFKEIEKDLINIILSESDPDSELCSLLQYLCRFTKRNIEFFIFSAYGGKSNSSHVDLMKTAIRRQIDVNQKATLPLIKRIDPISDLWKQKLNESNFEQINDYWMKNFDFPSYVVKEIKNDTSDYVHPRLPLRILKMLETKELAQRLYEDCGGNIKCLNYFTERLNLTSDMKDSLTNQVHHLFSHDLQSMMHFSDLFVKIIKTFNKSYIK